MKASVITIGWNSTFISSTVIIKFWNWLHNSALRCSLHILLRQATRLCTINWYSTFFHKRRTLCHNRILLTLSRYPYTSKIEWYIELKDDINIFCDHTSFQYLIDNVYLIYRKKTKNNLEIGNCEKDVERLQNNEGVK